MTMSTVTLTTNPSQKFQEKSSPQDRRRLTIDSRFQSPLTSKNGFLARPRVISDPRNTTQRLQAIVIAIALGKQALSTLQIDSDRDLDPLSRPLSPRSAITSGSIAPTTPHSPSSSSSPSKAKNRVPSPLILPKQASQQLDPIVSRSPPQQSKDHHPTNSHTEPLPLSAHIQAAKNSFQAVQNTFSKLASLFRFF